MKIKIEKQNILVGILALLLFSCEEVIDVELDSVDPNIVAEGVIEPGKPVWLQLSYTTDYFEKDQKVYEDEALVYLTDGEGNYDTLSYAGEGMYYGKNIIGKENTTYTLSVYEHNNGYQASSTLLPAPDIVQVWFQESSWGGMGGNSDEYEINMVITNDTAQDNFYLFKFYINDVPEVDRYYVVNSSYYADEALLEYNPRRISFEMDDHVKVVVHRIDEDTYNYYSQLNDLLESGMGGSSTPYNPQSNFGEDVMGYFSAWSYNSIEINVDESVIEN